METGSGLESTESSSSSFLGHFGLIWLLSPINGTRTQESHTMLPT